MTGLRCDGYRQMGQGISDEVASKPLLWCVCWCG